jgi:shikimate dehydrogenase
MINKDTLLFGSFAKEAGNTGCKLFNAAFEHYKLDAIYKSFSVDNIEDAVKAAKTLNFKGFAITMPFKIEVLKYVDIVSEECANIGAANTILNNNGILSAYNTDVYAAKEALFSALVSEKAKGFNGKLYILGNGGYSKAVQYAAKNLFSSIFIITRNNWSDIHNLENQLIYNCTPVENIKTDLSNYFIDCLVNTKSGQKLSRIQAGYQFKLYTGLELDYEKRL